MFEDDIRAALKKRPFTPFTVFTSDNEQFHVHHSDYAFLSPAGGSLEIWGEDARKVAWLNVFQVTRIETAQKSDEVVEAAPGNRP